MAYAGYLIKVGNFTISTKDYIKANSYSVTWSGQDLDSYRDADGTLHRNALAHPCIKVEFETRAMLTNTQMSKLMKGIRDNYINSTEKSVNVSAYNPETDTYLEVKCYVPDIQFSIYGNYGNKILYNSVRFAFIQY